MTRPKHPGSATVALRTNRQMNLKVNAANAAQDRGIEVTLVATEGQYTTTMGLEGTIYNHRDLERLKLAGKAPVPTTPMAAQVVNLDPAKVNALRRSATVVGNSMAKGLVASLQTNAPSVLRVTFCRLSGRPWRPQDDANLNHAVSLTPTQVYFVPARGPTEDPQLLVDRVRQAQAYLDRVHPNPRILAMPTVYIRHVNMRAMMGRLTDEAFEMVALEFQGMKKVRQNLDIIHAILRNVTAPPYVVAFNVPRHEDRTTFSASALVLSVFGVQASAQQVPVGFPPEAPPNPTNQRWFNPPTCDYKLAQNLPQPLPQVCGCLVHRGGQQGTGTAFLDQSNHEVDARRIEARNMAQAIVGPRRLMPYVNNHAGLVAGLAALT